MLLTIRYSGKRLNHSFQKRKITDHKLNSLKTMLLVLQDDDLIAKELNKFFKNTVSILNIKENRFITNTSSDGITDPIDRAIDKYKFHSSILLIPQHLKKQDIFSFKTVEIGDIKKESTTLIRRRLQLVITFLIKFLKSLLKFQSVFCINYLTML